MIKWVKKASGLYRLDITDDVVCLVSWNLMKRDITHKKIDNKIKNQFQKPSQNQYKYKGAVKCDNKMKKVYSNDLETVKRMTVARARQMMKDRLIQYEEALKETVNYE